MKRQKLVRSADRRIARDFSCQFCGHNLRGLLLDDRCPECGRPIRDTLKGPPPYSPGYRLARLMIGTAIAVVWCMGIVACQYLEHRHDLLRPGGIFGGQIAGRTQTASFVLAALSLATLAVFPRTRRDRLMWLYLVASSVGACWLSLLRGMP
ncbi:MAG: hypothetical protein AMXMBFR13_45000 [Phycisphaerae bacterium]